MELNFPYYAYPGIPCCGYRDIENYNTELTRLYYDLDNLFNISDKFIFHLTIGCAMEEYFNYTSDKHTFQWQQLFPIHLRTLATKGYKIVHYIVAPNPKFGSNNTCEPLFIQYTNDVFNWNLVGDRHYTSLNYDFNIYIYYTMMPHVDSRNTRIINQMKAIRLKTQSDDPITNEKNYLQTQKDISFTTTFYSKLKDIYENICSNDNFVTCFSFAVFNALTNRSHLKDFVMFSEIKNAIPNTTKSLLTEWTYYANNYVMDNNISYINYNESASGLFISIENDIIVLKKNHLLKTIYEILVDNDDNMNEYDLRCTCAHELYTTDVNELYLYILQNKHFIQTPNSYNEIDKHKLCDSYVTMLKSDTCTNVDFNIFSGYLELLICSKILNASLQLVISNNIYLIKHDNVTSSKKIKLSTENNIAIDIFNKIDAVKYNLEED